MLVLCLLSCAFSLVHDQWNYNQQGLTPARAALQTIAVMATTVGAITTYTAAGAASNAGFMRWPHRPVFRWLTTLAAASMQSTA